ncbi:MAG: hypothetical protein WBW41_09460, partial [Verrucomicrobiia bacterium]
MEFSHDFSFRTEPIIQGAARAASSGEPELVCPLFGLGPHPKTLRRVKNDRATEVSINQPDFFRPLFPAMRIEP